MSLFGALPFVFSGDIPYLIDAWFETVSGFTTTGASILENPELLSRGCLFWRLFTHWIGGMGVLVFIAAVLPVSGDSYIHIMRAEVRGQDGRRPDRSERAGFLFSVSSDHGHRHPASESGRL